MIDFVSLDILSDKGGHAPLKCLGRIHETQRSNGQRSIYINVRFRKINVQNLV